MPHRLNNLKTLFILFIISMSMAFNSAHAQVKYDGYSFVIDGVLLLQDSQDTMAFYYMPKAPSVSYKKDSTLEFLCMKYVGENDQPSGGLFHALFEFTVPEKELKAIELKLKKKFPGGKIKGQLRILPNSGENGEDNSPGFEVISAILQNGGEGGMTRSLVASGSAPLTPGSKAAVAALLDSRGATLLWASMEGPTSDISVGVRGYYEAILPSFNAKIVMNSESVHKAFSEKRYKSTPLTQNDIQKGIDSLIKSGTIKVEIVDRSKAFNLDNAAMQSLTDLLTTKAIDMMFVGYVGPSTTPVMGMGGMGMGGMGMGGMGMGMGGMGVGGMGMGGLMGMSSAPMNVTPAGIPPAGAPMDLMGGLAAGGALGAASGGGPKAAAAAVGVMAVQTGWGIAKDIMAMYQKTYKLVDSKQIKQSNYTINLSKSSSIKVPFYSAGNISGFFDKLKNDKRYFRIVNMNDPSFQKRDINFIIDNDYADAFNSILNFVSINFRKSYSNGQDTVFSKMTITQKDIDAGNNFKTVIYPRLGVDGKEWNEYEYQIKWSIKGESNPICFPEDPNKWIKATEQAISLVPPFTRAEIDVDANRELFQQNGYFSANINFASIVAGKPVPVKRLLLRSIDPEWSTKLVVYHDVGQPVVYQTNWFGTSSEDVQEMQQLINNYIFLKPPAGKNEPASKEDSNDQPSEAAPSDSNKVETSDPNAPPTENTPTNNPQ